MVKNLILMVCFLLMTFSAFAQKEAQLLARTYWVFDVDKMKNAHQTKYANFDDDISGMNDEDRQAATDQKAQDGMVLSVIGGIEMRFDANKTLQMYVNEALAVEGTWEITSTTLTIYTEQADEEYQLVEISENILTVARENGDMIYYKAKNPTKTSTTQSNQTSSQTKTNSTAKNGSKIAYKGMLLTYSGAPTSDYQLTYNAQDLKIESFSFNIPSTYCDCKVETKQGYETGRCVGERFNAGEDGTYIKNSKGVILVGYFNVSGGAEVAMILAPTAEGIQQALTTDLAELEKMAALLAQWYKL